MSPETRDLSGLYDKTKTVKPATQVDRRAGVAPPPRATRPTPTTPTPNPAAPLLTDDSLPAISLVVNETTPRPAPFAGQVTKIALAFTAEQMNWLRKTATRQDLWAGELFDQLFAAHHSKVTAAGIGRRTRGRHGSNYTGTRILVTPTTADALTALATELGASKAAVGRAIIEAARAES